MSDGGQGDGDSSAELVDFCERVLSYTKSMDQSAFVSDTLTSDATLRNLDLIGEAAAHVPDALRKAHAGIPWRTIRAMRNRIALGYLGINDDIIWTMIRDNIPDYAAAPGPIVGSRTIREAQIQYA